MTDFSYVISESDEHDRLQIVFVDRDFGAQAMLHVDRVGSRRGADNRPTHFVFPPASEPVVRRAVAGAVERVGTQAAGAQAAAEQQQRMTAAIEAASMAAAGQAAERADALDALVAANPVNVTFGKLWTSGRVYVDNDYIELPYAVGIPSRLKEAGAHFDSETKRWIFAAERKQEIEAMVPVLKRLVAAQRVKDAKKRAAPPRKPRGAKVANYDQWTNDDLQGLAADGLVGQIDWSGAEVRAELRPRAAVRGRK